MTDRWLAASYFPVHIDHLPGYGVPLPVFSVIQLSSQVASTSGVSQVVNFRHPKFIAQLQQQALSVSSHALRMMERVGCHDRTFR